MELNTGQWAVIGICALLIAGYIAGYFYNRRIARRISAWLLEGLKDWGQVTGKEKLPGMVTGGRLEIEQATSPMRQVEVIYLLAPRENPLFWIFFVLQGKRDELFVWISFLAKPGQAVEVARKGDSHAVRQFKSRLKATDKPALSVIEAPPGYLMAVEDSDNAVLADKVRSFAQRYPSVITRIAVRENKPHLFLRASLRAVLTMPAVEFFSALRELHQ